MGIPGCPKIMDRKGVIPHGDPKMSKNHGQERSNPPWGSQDVQKPWTEKE